jgi:hypothetical protein
LVPYCGAVDSEGKLEVDSPKTEIAHGIKALVAVPPITLVMLPFPYYIDQSIISRSPIAQLYWNADEMRRYWGGISLNYDAKFGMSGQGHEAGIFFTLFF